MPNVSRIKEIIKFRVQMTEIENRRSVEKINKTQNIIL